MYVRKESLSETPLNREAVYAALQLQGQHSSKCLLSAAYKLSEVDVTWL